MLDEDAAQPEEGDPFVVPISEDTSEGVLGVVTAVDDLGGLGVVVDTRPAPLRAAYAKVGLVGETLADLVPGHAAKLLESQFRCSKSKLTQGPTFEPDLGSMTLDVYIAPRRREFQVVLFGRPEMAFAFTARAAAQCEYVGKAGFPVVIPGTPVLIRVHPAARIATSGKFSTSFVWKPELEVGAYKRWGRPPRALHALKTPAIEPTELDGSGDASLFLGASVSLSVAGRVGLKGTAGPEVTSSFVADGDAPACFTGVASVNYNLTAFVDFWIKRREYPLIRGSYAEHQLWERGNCGTTVSPTDTRLRIAGHRP
ncbi:MAG TPA: hypothetical protein VHP56_02615 [Solirubrobacterales bacterium]|nr:hypothetical protein [Solirubrobacterales bacterium]